MKKKKKVSSSDKRTIGRILKYAARYKGSLALAMVFAVLYVIATLTAPVLIGYAIDGAFCQCGELSHGAGYPE